MVAKGSWSETPLNGATRSSRPATRYTDNFERYYREHEEIRRENDFAPPDRRPPSAITPRRPGLIVSLRQQARDPSQRRDPRRRPRPRRDHDRVADPPLRELPAPPRERLRGLTGLQARADRLLDLLVRPP